MHDCYVPTYRYVYPSLPIYQPDYDYEFLTSLPLLGAIHGGCVCVCVFVCVCVVGRGFADATVKTSLRTSEAGQNVSPKVMVMPRMRSWSYPVLDKTMPVAVRCPLLERTHWTRQSLPIPDCSVSFRWGRNNGSGY